MILLGLLGIPFRTAVIVVTGVLELAGAVGLLLRLRMHPHHGRESMKKMFLLLALVLSLGCQNKSEPPAIAASAGGSSETSGAPATVKSALVDRVWTRSDATELPGIMRIFLANGTLVIDSCWETYRLSEWQMESDSTMLWSEDGMDIRADVVSVDASGLVLRLRLTQGTEEQHYAPASVPFVCPDMPR